MTDTQWPHFQRNELQCRCGCGQMKMSVEFLDRLEGLRRDFGQPMPITSGFRCPAHNAKISKTGLIGPHVTGQAVDISVAGVNAYQLIALAMKSGFTGIGIKQHGPFEGRYVHLDTLTEEVNRPRPRIWTYA
ncbi:MAG: DUF882 domain-containing protein [Magnetococcales bacterium]|nr:DUF882 domain-containing protein [Magnetococcales bacterium]